MPPKNKKDKQGSDAKLCLNMIVKNEAHLVNYVPRGDEKIPVIQRCLENVGHLIDAIAIVDTGSTDQTIDIINKWAEEHKIPCQVKVDLWRDDFGYSRTVALRHGQFLVEKIKKKEITFSPDLPEDTPWYFMFMDADNLIWANDGKSPFPIDKKSLVLDSYRAPMRMANVEYGYVMLAKIDFLHPWQWYYPVHEFLSEMKGKDGKQLWVAEFGNLDGGFVDSRREGSRSHNPMKYMADAISFEKYLISNPFDDRSLYYLAQSYRDAGKDLLNQSKISFEKSKREGISHQEKRELENKGRQLNHLGVDTFERSEKTYIMRAETPPFNTWKDEYTYCAWFEAARIRRARKNRFDQKTINYLMRANTVRPNRLEAPYDLLVYYRSIEAWGIGWSLAKDLIHKPYPKEDIIFVDKDIHNYKFLFEASLFAYYVGEKSQFVSLTNKVIKSPHTSDDIRKLAQDNLNNYGKEKENK